MDRKGAREKAVSSAFCHSCQSMTELSLFRGQQLAQLLSHPVDATSTRFRSYRAKNILPIAR